MNGLREQNNLIFDGTSMRYKIGEYNKNLFVAGNSQTFGTFPGFKMNNQYRVYINYFDAASVQLNQAGGQVEQSLFASPMIKASPPLVRPHKVLVISLCMILNACISTECPIMCDSGYLDLPLQFSHPVAIQLPNVLGQDCERRLRHLFSKQRIRYCLLSRRSVSRPCGFSNVGR